jgi:hypothetical protein
MVGSDEFFHARPELAGIGAVKNNAKAIHGAHGA